MKRGAPRRSAAQSRERDQATRRPVATHPHRATEALGHRENHNECSVSLRLRGLFERSLTLDPVQSPRWARCGAAKAPITSRSSAFAAPAADRVAAPRVRAPGYFLTRPDDIVTIYGSHMAEAHQKTTVYLDAADYRRLKAIALARGCAPAQLVREAVARYPPVRRRRAGRGVSAPAPAVAAT